MPAYSIGVSSASMGIRVERFVSILLIEKPETSNTNHLNTN
jgi:hypothetical protein